ncbi:hypothetical protein [Micromonospora inyonensis]|uniref:Uncharacterized protein n=1 Tax=Micromonospora inyonensis TaxID=47866 RepID=A0A1C6RWB2_9ACTN|nr:hypothetical protein [Micromonospora inyonensis]SCL21531.1 hypothetical protein GA0074694_3062 [Micromonospora inyonensis]SCL21750.1 hypothetical protein GA0074694_3134 [Micromonospora inyonensis]
MTSIDDLARAIQDRHDIDTLAAALESVAVMVDQIADDPDLWDADTRTLTPSGVEVVSQAIAESYMVGAVATSAQILLSDIDDTAAEIAKLEEGHAELVARRDELIRAALRTELPRADIANAARVKPARLYQIRDGRR